MTQAYGHGHKAQYIVSPCHTAARTRSTLNVSLTSLHKTAIECFMGGLGKLIPSRGYRLAMNHAPQEPSYLQSATIRLHTPRHTQTIPYITHNLYRASSCRCLNTIPSTGPVKAWWIQSTAGSHNHMPPLASLLVPLALPVLMPARVGTCNTHAHSLCPTPAVPGLGNAPLAPQRPTQAASVASAHRDTGDTGAMRQRKLGSHTPPCHRRMVITTLFSVFLAALQRRPVLYHTRWLLTVLWLWSSGH